jgi:hypothetical protein
LAGTGIRRNPEESGVIHCKHRNSCPAGIPAKSENRNSSDPLQNLVPVKNSSGKHRKKRNPQEFFFLLVFEPQK